MTTLIEKISTINDLKLQGKSAEAFNEFYHDRVLVQDNKGLVCQGKKSNIKREEIFASGIIEFRCAKPLKVAIGEKITMVEWYFNFLHNKLGEQKYNQVAVQEWQDGMIIKEKRYYES
ncbi:MAG: hypothetical protein ACK5NB_06180 [Flavobacteriaceae bacterium]